VLYNTYWVRFDHPGFSHAGAVENTLKLFEAARAAGVRRVVHVSITNPAEDSPLAYFRGKARLERALRESGLSHAILRPAVLFGTEDVLINNIAWGLRRFPVVAVFGNGRYRLQPIHVDDLARLAVEQGAQTENAVIEAIGPETFAYRDLVRCIGRAIGKRRLLLPVPAGLGFLMFKSLGLLMGDKVLTREEIAGLMSERLYVDAPPAGTTKLSEWITAHAGQLGRRYANEIARRRDRVTPYAKL
jgi:uncharacterized protein YbjT (DUF2867 family)